MADRTRIEWTDATWNPVTGCTRISEGCRHCYIDRTPPFRMNGRFFRDRDGAYSREIGATTGVTLHPERLTVPLRKRSWRGKRVFVCSSADLFHDAVPDEHIARVFAVMALTPEVTYQVLTKRPARMRSLLSRGALCHTVRRFLRSDYGASDVDAFGTEMFPLPNVWLGVSTEDQATADLRIPILLDTPAAVRWVSAEPLIGRVDLSDHVDRWSDGDLGTCDWGYCGQAAIATRRDYAHDHPDYISMLAVCAAHRGIDWIVVGGESGPGCRPMDIDWARSLRDQCANADVPFFMKQLGGHPNKRDDIDDLPEDLRIREYPDDPKETP